MVNLLDIYLRRLLIPYVPTRALRCGSDKMLCLPQTQYVETHKRAFSFRAPETWNCLPNDDRDKDSDCVNSFKSKLKIHLFKLSFG